MPMLFLDLLGTKSIWQSEGRAAVIRRFAVLEKLVSDAVSGKSECALEASIESDSAVIYCHDIANLIEVGRTIFRNGFALTAAPPVWLRAVMVPSARHAEWRERRAIQLGSSSVTVFEFTDPLLDAINLERAGCKGMRLLVHPTLVTEDVKKRTRLNYHGRNFMPLRVLEKADYPERVKGYWDLLWMATERDAEWAASKQAMAEKLRFSFGSHEALLQAAATQVVFHQCNALKHAVRRQVQDKAARQNTQKGPADIR